MNPPLRDTAVIVLHFGSSQQTAAAVARLRAFYPQKAAPLVFVVENGPPPAAWDDESSLTVIRLPQNRGYAAASNAGIRAALAQGAQFLVLLNNDVLVEPGFLEAMRAAADDPSVGTVGAVLQETEGMVYGGGVVSWLTLKAILARAALPPAALHYVHGACLGLTRACAERVGLFSEDLFLYWEDVEFGLRVRRAGFRFAVAERPLLRHQRLGRSHLHPQRKTYYLVRNAQHVVHRGGPLLARWWADAILPLRRWHAQLLRKRTVARALADAQRGMTGPAPEDL